MPGLAARFDGGQPRRLAQSLLIGPSFKAESAGSYAWVVHWAVIVDTATDTPRFQLGIPGFSNIGFSVAASPIEEDVFFFLRSDGLLAKIRVGI